MVVKPVVNIPGAFLSTRDRFLKSTCSSLILHNLGCLYFNEVTDLEISPSYLNLCLYLLGVFAHLYQKFISVSFHIYHTFF